IRIDPYWSPNVAPNPGWPSILPTPTEASQSFENFFGRKLRAARHSRRRWRLLRNRRRRLSALVASWDRIELTILAAPAFHALQRVQSDRLGCSGIRPVVGSNRKAFHAFLCGSVARS